MNVLHVSKLLIEDFRRFHNQNLNLGDNVTLIAGQNGTSKSTLLGMLCQPFTFSGRGEPNHSIYTKNYHGICLDDYKPLLSMKFQYDSHEVFRLSKIHDTNDKKFSYRLFFNSDIIADERLINDGLLVRGEDRPTSKMVRFVASIGRSSKKGEGNFPHPVIYLGMERHWPLAKYKSAQSQKIDLNKEEIVWFVENYNQILLLDESDNITESILLDGKKAYIGISGADYNSESFSAGQNNIGQLLTAILSFKRLKDQLGNKFCGGLLLIDELDSTLHASSQYKLLEFLVRESKTLNLQIVATSHSLYLLEKAFSSEISKNIKVAYLERCDDNVEISEIYGYETIQLKLKSEAKPIGRNSYPKVSVLCEDRIAYLFLAELIERKYHKYIKRIDSPKNKKNTSSSYIKNLFPLLDKIEEFKDILLIPDGDVKQELAEKEKSKTNVLFLPSNLPIECTIASFLFSLKDSDPIWKKLKGENVNKQTLFLQKKQKYTLLTKNLRRNDSDFQEYKDQCKKWFKDNQPYFGKGCSIVFNAWIEANKTVVSKFREEFYQKLNNILRRRTKNKLSLDV